MKLENKVAIITGSSRGIGKETAILFAKEGASVIIVNDKNVEEGKETSNYIKEIGAESSYFNCDVSNKEQVKEMIADISNNYGKIDILINNAGVISDNFLVNMNDEDWDKVINVNLKGVFNCSRFTAKYMIKQGSGVILNTASIVGIYGNIGQTNYAASKFGVIGLTKTWAKELGPKGIRVNAVAPGFTKTEMISKIPKKITENVIKKTPLKRLGEPIDIACAYLFLASDEASFINGAVLSVDGGLVLG